MKKFFLKRKKLFFILLGVLAIFLIGKFVLAPKKATSNFVTVKKADIKEELTLSGSIEAHDHVKLVFATLGKVNWVGVKEGDWVKKGQEIASLDQETLNAALRQAWASFTAAKAASDKYYSGNNAGTGESYDQKIERTALDATQNRAYDSVRIAQENLKNANIFSPIDGLVVNADPSEAGVNLTGVNAGYEIVNPSTVYLKVTADQTEVGSIKEGQKGMMIFDSYPDEQIEGMIKDISFIPSADQTGTVYGVNVEFGNVNNKDYKYRLAMTADVNFVIKENKNALVIPSSYIKSDDKGKYVLVGEDKKKTYIKTGIENDQDAEVIQGLSEGDKVYD